MNDHAVVIAGTDGVIRFWSAGAEKLFGHAAGDSVGRTLDLIVPDEHRAAHWAGFRRAMASGKAGAEGQPGPFPVVTASGDIRAIQGRLTLVRAASGTVVGAMVVFG